MFESYNDRMHMLKQPNFPPVKFDLETRFGSIYGDLEKKAVADVIDHDAPTSGKKVTEFETKFAEFCGSKYAVAVSNGTTALMMAYIGVGIQPGDEVISTPITWIATSAAAVVLGATIKFADIDPHTFNLDAERIEKLITPKTKAICPVHLYGQPVDMDPINEIAAEHHLNVIEDAAHAPGALYKGKKTGNLGDVGIFSFHEQKNMSTLGEGGMVTTNSLDIFERMRLYKSHCARVIGSSTKYLTLDNAIAEKALKEKQFWFQDFDDCGYNVRMNDVTGAVGLCQLTRIDSMNARRNEIASILDAGFTNIPGIRPLDQTAEIYHTYHLYPVKIDPKTAPITRDNLVYKLRMDYGIKTGTHYMPLVETEAFKKRGYSSQDAPLACKEWRYLITLPIHPRLTDDAVSYMITSIREAMKSP